MPFAMINNWRALSLRRWSHLDELKRSGRWRGSFGSESALDEALRAAEADAAMWKALAEEARQSEMAGATDAPGSLPAQVDAARG